MPWQGNADTIIDRFDVRAHLDVIPEYKETTQEVDEMESKINYERYRILVQNDYSGVKENKFLHQIYLEERFVRRAISDRNSVSPNRDDKCHNILNTPLVKRDVSRPEVMNPFSFLRFGGSAQKKQDIEAEKRKLAEKKAAIGYHYEDSENTHSLMDEQKPDEEEAEEEASEEEIDLDIAFDVDQIPPEQAREMNTLSTTYGGDPLALPTLFSHESVSFCFFPLRSLPLCLCFLVSLTSVRVDKLRQLGMIHSVKTTVVLGIPAWYRERFSPSDFGRAQIADFSNTF